MAARSPPEQCHPIGPANSGLDPWEARGGFVAVTRGNGGWGGAGVRGWMT